MKPASTGRETAAAVVAGAVVAFILFGVLPMALPLVPALAVAVVAGVGVALVTRLVVLRMERSRSTPPSGAAGDTDRDLLAARIAAERAAVAGSTASEQGAAASMARRGGPQSGV